MFKYGKIPARKRDSVNQVGVAIEPEYKTAVSGFLDAFREQMVSGPAEPGVERTAPLSRTDPCVQGVGRPDTQGLQVQILFRPILEHDADSLGIVLLLWDVYRADDERDVFHLDRGLVRSAPDKEAVLVVQDEVFEQKTPRAGMGNHCPVPGPLAVPIQCQLVRHLVPIGCLEQPGGFVGAEELVFVQIFQMETGAGIVKHADPGHGPTHVSRFSFGFQKQGPAPTAMT